MTKFASLSADRPEFAPPPQRGTLRAIGLALIAHALLIAALTWGVRWKRESENDAVEAELWSSTVQQAAPRAVAPPPAPAPAPQPAPPPPPPPPPAPAVQPPPPAPPAPRQPDINLEQERRQRELREQREQEEQQRRQEQRRRQEAAERAAQEKREFDARKREQEETERKRQEQQKLADQRRKEAEDKRKAEAARQQAAAAQAAKDRDATIRRMQALAGTGGESATGTAARSSGPSGSYGAKVAAAVRPNITYPDADLVSGNPAAEFDVRLAPDGTIIGTPQLVKSSGVASWDEAALRGLQKTERLPRDVDGTVPSRLIVSLRPKR